MYACAFGALQIRMLFNINYDYWRNNILYADVLARIQRKNVLEASDTHVYIEDMTEDEA